MILGPRNFTTKKIKKGHLDSSLLSKPSYVSVEDPFKYPVEKVLRTEDKEGYKKAGHDLNFKPAKVVWEK